MKREGIIGIGITVHNRYDVFLKTYNEFQKYLPKNSKIIIVDDASDIPVPEASFRFEQNVGIARAKNKCLELLEDCDHIFLFDDDTYPVCNNWWQPYVESTEPHLNYIFTDWATDGGSRLSDCKELYRNNEIVGYSHPRGCMIYLDRKVIDIVGGFDTSFGKAMGEHIDLSNRIFNAGLTSMRYMDVIERVFHSSDEHREVSSSIAHADRVNGIIKNRQKEMASLDRIDYCPYKDWTPVNPVIISCYLTKFTDEQRGFKWQPKIEDVKTLIDSTDNLIILSDELEIDSVTHKVGSFINPYWQRIISEYKFLRENPQYDAVFLVDATDVEVLNDPFPHIKYGTIYVGDEQNRLGNPWMIKNHPRMSNFINRYAGAQLLNCGIIGGERSIVLKLLHEMLKYYFDNECVEVLEMGAFNYACYTKNFNIQHGFPVNTVFKKNEIVEGAWFRHK